MPKRRRPSRQVSPAPTSLRPSRFHHPEAVDDPLGTDPRTNVAVLADLGLSPAEIAMYFKVKRRRVETLLSKARERRTMPSVTRDALRQ